jgi:membrane protease YdiL (CAAX protease family)
VDGLAAVGLLAVASVTLTLAASLVPGRPPVANLPVLVAIYLATPPFEALVAGFALRRTGNWRAFLGQRYRFGPNWPNLVGLGVASGVAIEVASALLLALQLRWLGIRPVSNNPFAIPGTSVLHSPWAVAAVAVAVAAMAPLAEELLFRGVLFGGLRRRWPYPLASATSAAIFAAAHLDPTLLPALLAAGLWLNALYQRTGSLIPSTVAHATFNGLAVALAVGMHVG